MTSTANSARPATSLDVARLAGVSRSTVSNILNGNDSRFPETTREKVRSAAAELEYKPSLAGRSLVSGRSDTVIVLLPNASFGDNLQGAVDEVMTSTRTIGANVVVRFAGNSSEATLAAIASLRPLALIDFGVLSAEDRDELEQNGTIIVPQTYRRLAGPMDGGLAKIQGEALVKGGPRPLWFAALDDKRFDPYGPGRFAGLAEFSESVGLPAVRQVRVQLTIESGISALHTIIAEGTPVGVACYNDDVALTLLAAARELKIDVPSEISVVGVDFTPVGQLWSPRLTTIDTDLRGLVATLSEELRARLSGEVSVDETPRPHLHFTLIAGESS